MLGALIRKFWTGFYATVAGGEKKLATIWADYEAADFPGFEKASDAVITKFWCFFRVLEEDRDTADRTLRGACVRLTLQQWYNQKHTAANHFMSERGKRAKKEDNVKEMPKMTVDDYMSIMPNWADEKEDAWEALAKRWVGEDPDFDAMSKRNKANRGTEGTHNGGSRNHDRFKQKLEADKGEPVTHLAAWQKMKEKKPDLRHPQLRFPSTMAVPRRTCSPTARRSSLCTRTWMTPFSRTTMRLR